jgi:hypothetical protein
VPLRLTAASGVVFALLLTGSCVAPGAEVNPAMPGRHYFGTLVSRPAAAKAERQAGVTIAMVELSWANYEPARGQFNEGYADEMRRRVKTFLDNGQRVTLGLGLHFTPTWVFDIPNSRFVDQRGDMSREMNLVFNERLRQAVAEYLARLSADLDFADIWAIRLTSGGSAEVLYPSRSYAAFDENAQNGPDLPPSMPRNPYPGWRPGEQGLSPDRVAEWADWYIGALADVVDWQITTLEALGFRGFYQVMTPGSGARPDEYRNAVRAYLPDGLVGVGAAWDRFYRLLAKKPRLMAYVSSMADGSGQNDSCRSDDRSIALADPVADSWSATRWISRIADEYGLAKGGENPGWGDAPQAFYRDTSGTGLLATAVRQMTGCEFSVFYWAHDQQLWDGTVPFSAYADYIDRITGGQHLMPPPAS